MTLWLQCASHVCTGVKKGTNRYINLISAKLPAPGGAVGRPGGEGGRGE